MKISLPGIPLEKRLLWLVPGFAFINLAVVISASFSLRPATLLPLTRFDTAFPFLPWTIFVYLAHFPFTFLAVYGLKDRENFNRTAASILLVTFVTAPIFILAPTAMPSFEFPIPGGWTGALLRFTNHVNSSLHNACPSMHAGYALLAALGYRDEQKRFFLPAMTGAMLISLSTLLAKQHYVIDVPAGWAVAWVCRAAVDRFVEFY